VTFSDIFNQGIQEDDASPYQREYAIDPEATDGGGELLGVDRVGNGASSAFTTIKDSETPTITLLLPEQSGVLVEVAWNGHDSGRSCFISPPFTLHACQLCLFDH